MAKQKRKKQPHRGPVFSASALRQRERDTAYREALGVADGGNLPKKLGNTASAGAGRDRRGKVTKATEKNAAANRSRVKLIG